MKVQSWRRRNRTRKLEQGGTEGEQTERRGEHVCQANPTLVLAVADNVNERVAVLLYLQRVAGR